MAFTQDQLDALRAALATGTKRVRMNGEEVEYRTFDEMKALIAMMERSIGGTRVASFNPTYSKGF